MTLGGGGELLFGFVLNWEGVVVNKDRMKKGRKERGRKGGWERRKERRRERKSKRTHNLSSFKSPVRELICLKSSYLQHLLLHWLRGLWSEAGFSLSDNRIPGSTNGLWVSGQKRKMGLS